jgi:hypothetical protein
LRDSYQSQREHQEPQEAVVEEEEAEASEEVIEEEEVVSVAEIEEDSEEAIEEVSAEVTEVDLEAAIEEASEVVTEEASGVGSEEEEDNNLKVNVQLEIHFLSKSSSLLFHSYLQCSSHFFIFISLEIVLAWVCSLVIYFITNNITVCHEIWFPGDI